MQFHRLAPADFTRLVPQAGEAPEHVRNLVPLLEAFMTEERPS